MDTLFKFLFSTSPFVISEKSYCNLTSKMSAFVHKIATVNKLKFWDQFDTASVL